MKNTIFKHLLLLILCLFALQGKAQNNLDYLCFTAQEANSTVGYTNYRENTPNVEYSYDKTTWTKLDPETDITLKNIGDKVYFRGDNPEGFSKSYNNYTYFGMSGKISASGNIMSLVDINCESKTIPCEYCFCDLFFNCSALTSAPELPATTLDWDCYEFMFSGCTSLTTAPELPATTLAEFCYYYMFNDCTSLTTAPELPATTLAGYCYLSMFNGCTSLTTAPELLATTLAEYCYDIMFYGCESLNCIKVNFNEWKESEYATDDWVYNVSSTGVFICPSDLNIQYGSNYIPNGWTVINQDVKSIAFDSNINQNVKLEFIQGESLDFGKAQITVSLADNSTVNIPISACEITGYDANIVGTQTLTVSFKGQTTTFDVVVNLPTGVNDIEVNNVKIWSYSNTVYIENATDIIYIVNSLGKLIKTVKPNSTHIEIPLSNSGNYIIKTGNAVKHICIIKN